MRGKWHNDAQCAFRTICPLARFAELHAHAQNTIGLWHVFEFLVSGLDLSLSEIAETRELDHIRTIENAAKMAESESKRNVKRIENRKAKDLKRELVL